MSTASSAARILPFPLVRDVPDWDADMRELIFQGYIVKRFGQPAGVQELVLTVFQEEGWTPSILDPLPHQPGCCAKRRWNKTIEHLNRARINPLISFHATAPAKESVGGSMQRTHAHTSWHSERLAIAAGGGYTTRRSSRRPRLRTFQRGSEAYGHGRSWHPKLKKQRTFGR